ncbi:GNAT family N-acetyltransferase, partial [Candidatus Uhrbacteria bacterium]|nr:GNAT family N-acetyltransferase [Candidatus Uhrbacteria bacterium]
VQDDELRVNLFNRAHTGDHDFVPMTVNDLAGAGTSPHWSYDGCLVADLEGTPAGFATAGIEAERTDNVGRIGGPHVVPEMRRRGIGTALARAAFTELTARGRTIAHASAEEDSPTGYFLASLGFTEVRRFSQMVRHLDGLPQDAGASTSVQVAAVEPTAETIPMLVRLENESFKEHFNRPPETVAGFEDAERNLARHGIVSHISVAYVDGTPVGFISYGHDPREISAVGRKLAGLWDIGVLKPWRKRGIAKRLMLDAMNHLRNEGMDEVDLNVDETNVTGALHVYERLGFRVTRRSLSYRKDLGATPNEAK